MNTADKPAFAALLSTTMQTLHGDISPSVIDVWWNVLSRYELATVRRALSDHLQDPELGKWAPKPAEILARVRPRGPAYQPVPQLEHKKLSTDHPALSSLVSSATPRRTGPWWSPDKVRNQQQIDFIKLQADHFGEFSAADRFLRECQAVGIITHDFRLGEFNTREPGEDEIEHEEAA